LVLSKTGDGRPLPSKLKAEIGRELDRLELVKQQIAEVEAARDALLVAGDRSPGKLLLQLRSIDGSEIEPLVAGWSKVMVTVKPKFLEADSGQDVELGRPLGRSASPQIAVAPAFSLLPQTAP
jgi:hypothetical protein